MVGKGKGWITAEYNMLPRQHQPAQAPRAGGKVDGRTTEIQRLIGRSLRAVVDLDALGERSITVDCDVLEADGGTRTASITGGVRRPGRCPALDQGPARSRPLAADRQRGRGQRGHRRRQAGARPGLSQKTWTPSVDMNVVMTGGGRFVEVQGTGEEATFSDERTGRPAQARQEPASANWRDCRRRRSAAVGRSDRPDARQVLSVSTGTTHGWLKAGLQRSG